MAASFGSQAQFLKQSLEQASAVDTEISTNTAHYKSVFGIGDKNSNLVKGVNRFGALFIHPMGKTQTVKYAREELVYYVLEGTGMLRYNNQEIPISKDDFFYVPIGTNHSFTNPREDTLQLIVIGAEIPQTVMVKPTPDLKIASATNIAFQLLPQNGHGPSSRYQLLLGNTNSKRDRLAAAYQINSLYVIDFDPGGTNIPHRHENEEEIYMLVNGTGEMVAGETPDGKESRHPAKTGDVFFFSKSTLVGFYSSLKTAKEHARILAVRVKYPKSGKISTEKR